MIIRNLNILLFSFLDSLSTIGFRVIQKLNNIDLR